MHRLSVLAAALITIPALAQPTGSCAPGSAQRFLDASNVQASVFNTGSLFFGGSTTSADGYLVPKTTRTLSPIFAASIWIAGTVDGESRASAGRYNERVLRPGPLDENGTLPNPSDCSGFDRIYVVSRMDVESYDSGASPALDLAEWPVGLGAPTVDADGDPVPVVGQDQTIDLEAGERPDLSGSQMAFWVMNDVGAPRESGQSEPLGIEVQVSAFVVSTDGDLKGASNASFYRFEVINRSPNVIDDARFGLFTDADLGGAGDDYIGTDADRGMGFVYNSRDEDAVYSIPPALGIDLFSGLAASSAFIGGGPAPQEPATAREYHNVLRGLWPDGSAVRAFRDGAYQTSGEVTPYVYTGDPVTGEYWSEVNTDDEGTESMAGDRRIVTSADLGTLSPGGIAVVDIGILFAQGADRFDSVTQLRDVSDGIQMAYDAGRLFREGPNATVSVSPEPSDNPVTLTDPAPNPVSGASEIAYTLAGPSAVELAVFDVLGRRVVTLVNERQPEGSHTSRLDAGTLAPGVYVVRLRAGEATRTARITVAR